MSEDRHYPSVGAITCGMLSDSDVSDASPRPRGRPSSGNVVRRPPPLQKMSDPSIPSAGILRGNHGMTYTLPRLMRGTPEPEAELLSHDGSWPDGDSSDACKPTFATSHVPVSPGELLAAHEESSARHEGPAVWSFIAMTTPAPSPTPPLSPTPPRSFARQLASPAPRRTPRGSVTGASAQRGAQAAPTTRRKSAGDVSQYRAPQGWSASAWQRRRSDGDVLCAPMELPQQSSRRPSVLDAALDQLLDAPDAQQGMSCGRRPSSSCSSRGKKATKAWQKAAREGAAQKTVTELYQAWDADGDGVVSRTDVRRLMRFVLGDQASTDECVDSMMKCASDDGTYIEFDQFFNWVYDSKNGFFNSSIEPSKIRVLQNSGLTALLHQWFNLYDQRRKGCFTFDDYVSVRLLVHETVDVRGVAEDFRNMDRCRRRKVYLQDFVAEVSRLLDAIPRPIDEKHEFVKERMLAIENAFKRHRGLSSGRAR
eukprot:TRINITY_DN22751_c0_g1_i2.p1 TRINITY_DN22751_c0_g1~~TRINITY_DN22751_c0_g1_i2.p1  ORF type:complete len:481 (-),score=50.14 TRINITY_DN22751_c0_g1_i2:196-1638(-)